MLEWQKEQDLLCPGCGQPRDESMADEHVDPDVASRYDAEAWTCHACRRREIELKKLTAFDGGLEGVYVVINPKRST